MKKFLLMTVILWAFCTMLCVCCNAAIADSDLTLLCAQDYEGSKTYFMAADKNMDHYDDVYEIKTEKNGNKYLDLTIVKGTSGLGTDLEGYAMKWGYGDINFEYGVVARLDVCKLSEGAPVVLEMNDYDNDNKFAYVGFRSTDIPETNVWYTVEIRYVGREGQVTLRNRETGEESTAEAVLSPTGLSREKNSFRLVADTQRNAVYKALIPEGYTAYDTHYLFDNIKVYSYTPQVSNEARLDEGYDDLEAELFLTDAAIIRKGMQNGNAFAEIDVISPAGAYIYNTTQIPEDNFRVTFDVKKTLKSASFNLEIHTVDSSAYVYAIPAVQLDEGVWYTYRIERIEGSVKAYRKEQKGTIFEEITVYPASQCNSVTDTGIVDITGEKDLGFFGADAGAKPSGSSYAVDNVLIENINTAKVQAKFENNKVRLYSDIFGALDAQMQTVCKAILVCYDNKGAVFEVKSADVSATDGKGSVTFDIARADDKTTAIVENAAFTKVKNGGSAKVFFWKGFDNLLPLTAELDVTGIIQ